MLEKPQHPREYARKYRAWEMDMNVVEQILTCVCGACAVCCIVRPFALKAEFPEEPRTEDEEYPEDDYYEDSE